MDTATLLSIFLAFVSVTLIVNSVLIWFMYRGLATFAEKATTAARQFEASGATREWIRSLDKAAAQAVEVTAAAKEKIGGYASALEDFQARYEFELAKIDTNVERVAAGVTDNLARVQEAVVNPAEKFGAVASGIRSALGFFSAHGDGSGE